jgi:hypothetical protein
MRRECVDPAVKYEGGRRLLFLRAEGKFENPPKIRAYLRGMLKLIF